MSASGSNRPQDNSKTSARSSFSNLSYAGSPSSSSSSRVSSFSSTSDDYRGMDWRIIRSSFPFSLVLP